MMYNTINTVLCYLPITFVTIAAAKRPVVELTRVEESIQIKRGDN